MKKIVEEVTGEGLEALLGEVITLFCCRYIYTGKLIGVNDNDVLLTNAGIVYETGTLTDNTWKDMQPLPHDWYVKIGSIESYGVLKCII
jgi:hypothetical protein